MPINSAHPLSPELLSVLEDFRTNRRWGSVQLDYQRGELVVIRRTETLKPFEGNTHERNHTQR